MLCVSYQNVNHALNISHFSLSLARSLASRLPPPLYTIRYEGGRFVMRKKVIDAKELARVAREQVVARLVYGDDVKPPRENPPR